MGLKEIRERLDKASQVYPLDDLRSTSQSGQDVFAFVIGNITQNKSYLEVGAKLPHYASNTRFLELNGWSGFSIEKNLAWKHNWDASLRDHTRVFWEDALLFDYSKLPKNIGFLSCDIDPPLDINFTALKRIINFGIQFDSICYEHNACLKKGDVFKKIQMMVDPEERIKEAEDLLYSFGYKKVIANACANANPLYPFEDWYIHNSIDFPKMTHDEFLLKYEDIFWQFYRE